jgi:hypothetical protein
MSLSKDDATGALVTADELIRALSELPPEHRAKQVKAWLPGSTIYFDGQALYHARYDAVLIPGNLTPGSALSGRD